MTRSFWRWFGAAAVALIVGGCSSKPAKPRTLADMQEERDNLPYLFLTEKTNHEVFAPLNKGRAVFDPSTGEIAWLAYTCTNPNCPGKDKGQNGRPFLFTWRDPSPEVHPDGKVTFEKERGPTELLSAYLERMGGDPEPICPECRKLRDLKTESAKKRMQYHDWVKVYIPPEQIERAKQLDAEIAAFHAALKARQERKSKNEG